MDALSFNEIEQIFKVNGLKISGHWWMKLKMAWYRYTDKNARENTMTKGGSCCSQPKDIYAQRYRRR